ncbi:MAG: hypothetical protein AAF658_18250 [Myxococcota bacterium]
MRDSLSEGRKMNLDPQVLAAVLGGLSGGLVAVIGGLITSWLNDRSAKNAATLQHQRSLELLRASHAHENDHVHRRDLADAYSEYLRVYQARKVLMREIGSMFGVNYDNMQAPEWKAKLAAANDLNQQFEVAQGRVALFDGSTERLALRREVAKQLLLALQASKVEDVMENRGQSAVQEEFLAATQRAFMATEAADRALKQILDSLRSEFESGKALTVPKPQES